MDKHGAVNTVNVFLCVILTLTVFKMLTLDKLYQPREQQLCSNSAFYFQLRGLLCWAIGRLIQWSILPLVCLLKLKVF